MSSGYGLLHLFNNHINWNIVFFGFLMAGADAMIFPLLKLYSIGKIKSLNFMAFASLVYAIQPWIFLRSLRYETMTVMNLYWDVASDLIVTFIGLVIFGETIGYYKKIGIFFSMLALGFMSYEDVKK